MKLNQKDTIIKMRGGVAAVVVLAIIAVLVAAGYYIFTQYKQEPTSEPLPVINRSQPKPTGDIDYEIGNRKLTTPNNTSNWKYFSSELYKYSLRYPNNFKLLLGNANLFQATSSDYKEENGIVTTGAIVQVIAADNKDSFEDAWGNIDKALKNLNIDILSKESTIINDQEAYKFRLANSDGTTEIRYLTYKKPYSYKASIVIGKNSQKDMDDYEQILDDIISTLNF